MRGRNWFSGIAILTLASALASGQTAPPYVVLTTALPGGVLGVPYGPQPLDASIGYEGPNVWSIIKGNLPPGFALSNPLNSDGNPDLYTTVISGIPTTPGVFNFTVQVDQAGNPPLSATQDLSISILGIATTSLPDGKVGLTYSQTISAVGVPVGDTQSWTVMEGGNLPPGLSLSLAGVLAGIPTVSGAYSFDIQLACQSPSGAVGYATQSFTLTIVTNLPPITITTNPALPAGSVGIAYTQQITATGGVLPYSWSVSSGTLPGGISLNAATGLLSGTPTSAGSFNFQLTASDQSGGSYTVAFTMAVVAQLSISTAPTLPAGVSGVPYSTTLSATGGAPPYAWSVVSGSLPDGISLNANTGVLSGTPTSAGTFSFQMSVNDARKDTATGAFTILVNVPLSITSPPTLPAGVSGIPYSITLQATGGTAPYTWSMLPEAGPLPPGLALDPSTGRLTGTPTASGSYQFLAGVADAAKLTASKLLTINIGAVLSITTASPLPNGTVGSAYQLQLTATGGTPAYTWSIASGALPAGLALDPSTGMLAGTPSAGGTFDVTIGVKDAVQSVTKPYRLTISVPALPTVTITGLPDSPPPATQPALGIGLSAQYTLDITGHATLAFAPDAGADDPAVLFTTGGRSADFQIPAGSTQAVFGGSSLGVQTGTVAGTITITLQTFAAGVDVTPTPAPTQVMRIAGSPPVITSAKLVATSTGFNLVVIGYATTREITGATVHLTPASGAQLATSDFTISLTSVFTAWYQDPNSAQYGSQFSLNIPFSVQNVANAVGSLTVTLANSQGTSASANATF